MKKAARTSTRWFAVWRTRTPSSTATTDDAADYGTAFGMEMTLPAPEQALVQAPAPRAQGWVARLVRRSSAA